MGNAQKKVTQMMRCTASLTFFTARLGLISVMSKLHKQRCETMSIGQKKVTQMMRCTAGLTFFTARLGLISVMRNISSGVKRWVLVSVFFRRR